LKGRWANPKARGSGCATADLRLRYVRRLLRLCRLPARIAPTHIRSTAVGFCTGSARVITSFGPLVAGLLVGAFGGSFNRVTSFMTCSALLSIVTMLLGRETVRDTLPR
jgi:cyanate permease